MVVTSYSVWFVARYLLRHVVPTYACQRSLGVPGRIGGRRWLNSCGRALIKPTTYGK